VLEERERRIVDLFRRGSFIEAKLSQAAFDLEPFLEFVAVAKKLKALLYYFFLKAPSAGFAEGGAAPKQGHSLAFP